MRLFCLLLFGLPALAARADVTLAPIFSHSVVLQSDKTVPIWGRAAPGEVVVVSFRGQSVRTSAGADGRWIAYLQPMSASADPATLDVVGRNLVTIYDVLVGEVWIASGQSNMDWPVNLVRGAAKEMVAANFPFIRHVRIEPTAGPTATDMVKTSGWQRTTPETVGGFAAVPFFFARHVHRRIGVPIGIISASWGGTDIEAWMSDDARRWTTVTDKLVARWEQAKREWPPERVARYPADMETWQKAEAHAKATKTKNPLPWPKPPAIDTSPARPGGPYNGMIAPLQPCAMRGFLWYQGESNVAHADEYGELFVNLIRTWRTSWRQNDLPFFFVQLPNYADADANGTSWALMREAQAKALALPSTGMAVTIDIGESDNLHPTDKQEVGRRLALIALSKIYDIPTDWSGPQFTSTTREGGTMRVKFQHATTGLIARDGEVQSLEIAGADKVFHPAISRIEGDILIVSSPQVPEPVAVRYAWKNAPKVNLFNRAGLPAVPFRTDTW
ncbi:MAG TPA: sialate O-acetylesterase [Opitutaceae bacterium]|nr:sialate O-acetylesterase [Opitutaceae bacterium]